MRVAPVSFHGRKEISERANNSNLRNDERRVAELAMRVHDIEVCDSSDGYYCSDKDFRIANQYVEALRALTMPSTFGFHAAIDTLNAEVFKAEKGLKEDIREIAVDIAKNSPGVGKYDIIKNWDILTSKNN